MNGLLIADFSEKEMCIEKCKNALESLFGKRHGGRFRKNTRQNDQSTSKLSRFGKFRDVRRGAAQLAILDYA